MDDSFSYVLSEQTEEEDDGSIPLMMFAFARILNTNVFLLDFLKKHALLKPGSLSCNCTRQKLLDGRCTLIFHVKVGP